MRKTSIGLVVASLALVGCSGGVDYYCAVSCGHFQTVAAYPNDVPEGQDPCQTDAVKVACPGDGVSSCTCNRQPGQSAKMRRAHPNRVLRRTTDPVGSIASLSELRPPAAPRDLRALEGHRAIVFTQRGGADWRFIGSRAAVSVRGMPVLAVNSGIVMRDAAIAGLGIALLPTFIVHDALADGRLEVVDVGLEPEPATLALAYPKDRKPPAKVLALGRALRQAFGDPPYWDRPRRG